MSSSNQNEGPYDGGMERSCSRDSEVLAKWSKGGEEGLSRRPSEVNLVLNYLLKDTSKLARTMSSSILAILDEGPSNGGSTATDGTADSSGGESLDGGVFVDGSVDEAVAVGGSALEHWRAGADGEGGADRDGEISHRDAARAQLSKAKSKRGGFVVPSTDDELTDAKARFVEDSWQMELLRFINSHRVQRFFVGLLLVDVLILFSELAIDAYFPACSTITRDAISCCPLNESSEAADDMHRFLGGGGGYEDICSYPLVESLEYSAGCDYHKWHTVHVIHTVLFWTTVAILGTFEVELFSLIYLIGPSFFKECMYMVDLIIVSLSLGLELLFKFASMESLSVVPGLLVMFRIWRCIRIGHGLVVSTYEVQDRRVEMASLYIGELEEKLKQFEELVPDRPKRLRKSIERHLSCYRDELACTIRKSELSNL